MTTGSVSPVWMGRLLRSITALALALSAAVAAGVFAAAVSASVEPWPARPAGLAIPAIGRPPVLADDPPRATPAPTATPRPDRQGGVSTCPSPSVRSAAAGTARRRLSDPVATPCPVSTPAPTLVASRPPPPVAPLTATPAATARPRPAVATGPAAVATGTPRPHVPQALPVPPPIWLTPSLVPVPQSYAAQLAPTSVLVLGFGSVALASAAMTLRLLRRGR
ncbi:MAG TPA: hypothetical protein VGL20_14655 [Candidatus Dormibacteraeota bacterium]|jgi:hypothetical protein